MDETLRQKMLQALQRPKGLAAAREFLQTYCHDADMQQLRRVVEHMMTVNPSTIIDGLVGIEEILATPQPPGVLAELVAFDANRALDDPSDEGARAWLVKLATQLRGWMGDGAPPPRPSAAYEK